jgi:septal ring factor EnvC (AmiA/AmiB activator)
VVQHNNNFVSIYRNIGDALRRIGDKVTAGEKITLAGTSLNKVVVFELWRSGIAVDPMQYIVF